MLTLEYVKSKSQTRIDKLHPVVKEATEKLIENAFKRGVAIVIVQGFRSYAEQNALYAQGRGSDTRPIVTQAEGGESYHNFGVAIDFALLLPDGRKVSWDTLKDGDKDSLPDWSEVVEEAKKLGFDWGGDWRSFKDLPHFEMSFGLSVREYDAGKKPSQNEIDKIKKLLIKQEVMETIMKSFSKFFEDVPKEWQASSIDAAVDKGLFAVGADKKFRPDEPITRAEIAIVMDRAIGYVLNKVK